MNARKALPVNIKLRVVTRDGNPTDITVSVRNYAVAIWSDDRWPHLSLTKAKKLRNYLDRAIAEIEARRGAK